MIKFKKTLFKNPLFLVMIMSNYRILYENNQRYLCYFFHTVLDHIFAEMMTLSYVIVNETMTLYFVIVTEMMTWRFYTERKSFVNQSLSQRNKGLRILSLEYGLRNNTLLKLAKQINVVSFFFIKLSVQGKILRSLSVNNASWNSFSMFIQFDRQAHFPRPFENEMTRRNFHCS